MEALFSSPRKRTDHPLMSKVVAIWDRRYIERTKDTQPKFEWFDTGKVGLVIDVAWNKDDLHCAVFFADSGWVATYNVEYLRFKEVIE